MAVNSRRRVILSVSLACLLLGACGAAGYFAYSKWQAGGVAQSAGFSEELEQGFADDAAASAMPPDDGWVDVPREAPITPASHQAPVAAEEAAAPLPPLPAYEDDRYEVATEAQQPLPPLEQVPLQADVQQYPAADSTPGAPVASPELPPVARGQTPQAGDLPPLGEVEPNPLRADEGATTEPTSAAEAFADSRYEATTAGPSPLEPPPTGALEANPLRSAQPSSDPDPQSVGRYGAPSADIPPSSEFADARPLGPSPASEMAPTLATGEDFPPQDNTTTPYGASDQSPPLTSGDFQQQQQQRGVPQQNYQPEPTLETEANPYAPVSAANSAGGAGGRSGTGRPGEQALEGPQRPALVLQKFAPAEIQVGKTAKFVIKLRNVGQRPADDVQVTDEIPQGTQLVGTSPQADSAGGVITWSLGSLSPGEERSLEIELMPVEEGEIGSVAKVTFASHASVKTRCTRPQLAVRLTSPPEVLVGRQQPITIELHNPGTGDATGVMLLENVPENVSHQAGPSLEFEVGTLRAGETRRMELMLTAEKPGHVVNVLTAQADGNLQVQQQVEFDVIAPSLAVDIEGPTKRYLERTATYTVTVDNPGTATARDVQLVTKLPRGMQFKGANNLGEYDAATHSVYWSLAELPAGEKGVVELVTLPVQPGDHTLEVEGRAREGLQDRTTQQVSVEGLAAIMFEVADTADPIEVGGSTSYDIRVVNQGSKAASNVQVRVLIPRGMKVAGATGETRHVVEAEGVIFAPLAKLAPKADSVFRVQLEGTAPGDQRVAVEVTTEDISQPIRKEESTRVFGDE